jgi:hypothetical protein
MSSGKYRAKVIAAQIDYIRKLPKELCLRSLAEWTIMYDIYKDEPIDSDDLSNILLIVYIIINGN